MGCSVDAVKRVRGWAEPIHVVPAAGFPMMEGISMFKSSFKLILFVWLFAALSILALTFFADAPQNNIAFASSLPRVTSIWGGARHLIALKSDGTVWDWGYNWYGKLGDGTLVDRHTPIQVHGPGDVAYLSSITAIMGGESHNFALKSDGTIWSWGWNGLGQLGDGSFTDRYTPVQVNGLGSVTALGGRGYHSLAIKTDGTVWTWGYNVAGELGYDTSSSPCPPPMFNFCSSLPGQVMGLSQVMTVTGGYVHSLAVLSDQTLRAWGGNSDGQLGNGDASYLSSMLPVTVSGLMNVSQVSAGWKHSLALKTDGTVWAWGRNDRGEVGTGMTTTKGITLPVQVTGLNSMTAVSGGDCHSISLKSDGTVWSWGCNDRGQLGDGTWVDKSTPVRVNGLTNVIFVTARDYHNAAIKSDGSVWTWGWNINGQLGDNTTTDRNVPVRVILDATAYLPMILK
jgi:alpha-tubulin suppressor-like RCC1 family protein